MKNSTLVKRVESVLDAHNSGDYEGTVFLLKRLAADGESAACTILGEIFEYGRENIPRDYAEALRWYKEALVRSYEPRAHLGIARIYHMGLGVEKDNSIALQHLLKIDGENQPGVHYLIGVLLSKVMADKHSLARAEENLRKGTVLGHLLAKATLGRFLIRTGRIITGLRLVFEAFRQMIPITDVADWRISITWVFPDAK